MDIYEYKGRNKRGEIMQGTIQSPNPAAVAAWMTDAGISPIHIRMQVDKLKGQPQWLRALQRPESVKPVDLLLFTRQMGTMAKAGVPVMQALSGMLRSTASPALADIIKEIRIDLDKGAELSAAMARHPKVFDEYYVSMVRVGESSGQMEAIFKGLYHQLGFDRQMKQKMRGALRYPTFVLSAMAIAVSIMTVFVIPVFSNVFSSMHVSLPVLTVALLAVSNFAVRYWWAVLAALAGAAYGFRAYIKLPEGRYRWDKFKLGFPVVGKILQKATLARFCSGFATASRNGVPLEQTFTLVSRVVDNAFYAHRILLMREGVERGDTMLRVAQASGIFTPLELQMIAVGEESGDVEGMLLEVSDMYREDVEYEVSRMSQTVEPILLAFMGVLVAILMLAIFMPLWDLTKLAHKPV